MHQPQNLILHLMGHYMCQLQIHYLQDPFSKPEQYQAHHQRLGFCFYARPCSPGRLQLFEWHVSQKRNRNNKGMSIEIVSRFSLILVLE